MLAIQLDPETESRLQRLADEAGRTKDDYVRQALIEHLEDMEDVAVATQRLQSPAKTYSAAEVRHELVYRFDERALKELRKLGKPAQAAILAYLDERVAGEGDPRRFGKSLRADLAGLWRYRVGDFRIVCRIKDGELLVLVLAVGHRRDVYD